MRRWVLIKTAQVLQQQQQNCWCPQLLCLLIPQKEHLSGACMSLSNHLHVKYPIGAGKWKFGTEHTRAQGTAWPSPLTSTLATFVYHSAPFTPFQGTVLVPFLAEWQIAPAVGSWAAWFRLSVCQVSRLMALAYGSTARDLKERKHNWWQLVVWQPGGLSQAHPKRKCHFWVLRRAEWA